MPPVKKKQLATKKEFLLLEKNLLKIQEIYLDGINLRIKTKFNESTSYATWLVIISWLMFGIGCLIATYVKSI